MDATPELPQEPASGLTAERAAILLKADLVNAANGIKNGKTLSPSVRKLLQSVANGGRPAELFVSNIADLADSLGVSRKTIQRHQKKDGHPEPRPDGRHDVSAWREYLRQAGSLGDDSPTQAQAKARQILLQNEKLEFQLNVLRKEFAPKSATKRVWTQLVNAAKARSFSSVARLVTLIRLAPDTTAANQVCRDEMVEIWREMEKAEWFQPNP